MATSSQDVINIDDLSASTEKELEMLLPLTNDCCISRVPEMVRKSNEHYYTPKVVSIGPIHYGKMELRAMEEYKKRYLKDFLKLGQASLKACFELVQRNETNLRNCYAVAIELDSKDFVKMVLLDAVFLLITLLYNGHGYDGDILIGRKRIFEKPTMIRDILYDLVLLENQLPFFIIEELYKLSNIHTNLDLSSLNEETAMITLAIALLDGLLMDIPNQDPPTEVEHLLALLRKCLKPTNWNPTRKPLTFTSSMIPNIKELNQAGVKFKASKNRNLFDIKFNKGELEIPYVIVHNYTELVFRNLMAFENCNNLDLLCNDYFIMMQKFTIAPADAEVLIGNKIIISGLPDAQAVSTLFHHLAPGFLMDERSFGYTDVISGLNAHYDVRWNKWKATWIQRYFKAPWAIFSFSGAVILLILTIVQAVCSILQVVND